MAVKRNESVPVREDLDDDIFRLPDKGADSFQLFLVNVKLGRLYLVGAELKQIRSRILRYRVAAGVIITGNMRRMKTERFNQRLICGAVFSADDRPACIRNLYFVRLLTDKISAVLIENVLGKTVVLIMVDSLDIHGSLQL